MPLVDQMLTDGPFKTLANLMKILVVCAVLGTATVVGGVAVITSEIKVLAVEFKNLNTRVTRLETVSDNSD